MNEGAETAVEVVDISKNYGPVMAVRSLSLAIPGGEYFVLPGSLPKVGHSTDCAVIGVTNNAAAAAIRSVCIAV